MIGPMTVNGRNGYVVITPSGKPRGSERAGWMRITAVAEHVAFRPWDKPLGLLLTAYLLVQAVKSR